MNEVNLKHRYWVFDIPEFYPSGGLEDTVFTTDNLEHAHVYYEDNNDGDLQLFDSVERTYYRGKYDNWL